MLIVFEIPVLVVSVVVPMFDEFDVPMRIELEMFEEVYPAYVPTTIDDKIFEELEPAENPAINELLILFPIAPHWYPINSEFEEPLI